MLIYTAWLNFAFALSLTASTFARTSSFLVSIFKRASSRTFFTSARVLDAFSRMFLRICPGATSGRGFSVFSVASVFAETEVSSANTKDGANKSAAVKATYWKFFILPFYTPFLFCKSLLVESYPLGYCSVRRVAVFELAGLYFRGLALKSFVRLKEVFYLLNQVLVQVFGILYVVPPLVLDRHGDYFCIILAGIVHLHNRDGSCRHQDAARDRKSSQKHHVESVPVVPIGLRNKPVVEREGYARVICPVEPDHSGFLIYFIFITGPVRRLNNDVDLVGGVIAQGYIVPQIHISILY